MLAVIVVACVNAGLLNGVLSAVSAECLDALPPIIPSLESILVFSNASLLLVEVAVVVELVPVVLWNPVVAVPVALILSALVVAVFSPWVVEAVVDTIPVDVIFCMLAAQRVGPASPGGRGEGAPAGRHPADRKGRAGGRIPAGHQRNCQLSAAELAMSMLTGARSGDCAPLLSPTMVP